MANHLSPLDKPLWNVLGITSITIILEIIWINSGVLDNAGMGAIVLNWLPLIIGIGTILLYLLSRLITHERNWILSLIGVGMNVIIVLRGMF